MGVFFSFLIWFLILGLVAGRIADRIVGGRKRGRDAVFAGAAGAILGGTFPMAPGSPMINVGGALIVGTLAAILILIPLRRSRPRKVSELEERRHDPTPI